MIGKVIQTIKKYELLNIGDSIVVGVSGGADSICLLHVLHSLAQKLKIKIYASHINHMLRGAESDGDEAYVIELCEKLGISVSTKGYDIAEIANSRGLSLEEAGREVRYMEFQQFAQSVGASKIAVAHNRNDQAETVLMNIIRGSGLDGLKGITHKRGNIIRPILDISRAEIERYCSEHSLSPRVDSSNLKKIYTRNKVRLDLIPYINGLFNTDITESIYKMSSLLNDDNKFIEEYAAILYNQCNVNKLENEKWLDIQKLKQYHPAMLRRVIRNAIKDKIGDLKGIESKHINSVITLIQNGKTGGQTQLPHNILVVRSYNNLKIFSNHNKSEFMSFCKEINIPGTTYVEELGHTIYTNIIKNVPENINEYKNNRQNSHIQFFDYEKLKSETDIRNRKEGDMFKPYKSTGTKKLKEYFIDNKIPRDERDKIPVIAKKNEIVWVIGYKISDKFAVTENTKSIVQIKFIVCENDF